MVEATLTITHEVGLHARPAAMFAKAAQGFASNITIRNVTRETAAVNAKSVISLFKAAVAQNHTVHIAAEGDDEQEALAMLTNLIETNFGEA